MNYPSYDKMTLWATYDNDQVESLRISPPEITPQLVLVTPPFRAFQNRHFHQVSILAYQTDNNMKLIHV